MTDAAATATDAATTTTDIPANGVEFLRSRLERALTMVGTFGVSLADVDEVLREALDVVAGFCGPHMRIQPAPHGVTFFAVKDTNGGTVVEYMPDRTTPYHAVDWSDSMQHAELVAALLNDNERQPNRRLEVTNGARLPVDE